MTILAGDAKLHAMIPERFSRLQFADAGVPLGGRFRPSYGRLPAVTWQRITVCSCSGEAALPMAGQLRGKNHSDEEQPFALSHTVA